MRARPLRERGVVLVFGLIFLIVLTIIGLTAMRAALTEEKMAGNSADYNLAFQAAEMALRDAEQDIWNNLLSTSGFDVACPGGLCLPSNTTTPTWIAMDWYGALPRNAASAASMVGNTLVRQPRYIIELLPDVPPGPGNSASVPSRPGAVGGGTAFRVTAVGWGGKDGTQVMVQSVFVKR
jgi:type IV pilus assembly protein PilX